MFLCQLFPTASLYILPSFPPPNFSSSVFPGLSSYVTVHAVDSWVVQLKIKNPSWQTQLHVSDIGICLHQQSWLRWMRFLSKYEKRRKRRGTNCGDKCGRVIATETAAGRRGSGYVVTRLDQTPTRHLLGRSGW